ncbi:hypothetical protein GOP47_0023221 [Adiantum capillus-veneris]|uniref:Uncharacterized protein n=1 Tax=Adiantum capillus-veneris TaxID=13818 RepID=A0A9D4U7Z3_ADICA|nr:hypothetical protein GOP47_0023221 [Adiantum capillus-veneris]
MELERGLHYTWHCPVYYEIQGRFHYLFKEGFGPFSRVMGNEDQRYLGLLLLELCRHKESLMRGEASKSQRKITSFFRPHSPHTSTERRSWGDLDVHDCGGLQSIDGGCIRGFGSLWPGTHDT